MNLVYKKTFEVFVLILIGYYSLILMIFEPVNITVKFTYIITSFALYLVFLVFGIAFRKELDKCRDMVFAIFINKRFSNYGFVRKLMSLVFLSMTMLLIISLIEYTVLTLFVKGGGISIGFPLSLYSFSAGKVLTFNFLINLFIYLSIFHFLGYILMKNDKKF
jgi:hypothetical protein